METAPRPAAALSRCKASSSSWPLGCLNTSGGGPRRDLAHLPSLPAHHSATRPSPWTIFSFLSTAGCAFPDGRELSEMSPALGSPTALPEPASPQRLGERVPLAGLGTVSALSSTCLGPVALASCHGLVTVHPT